MWDWAYGELECVRANASINEGPNGEERPKDRVSNREGKAVVCRAIGYSWQLSVQ